MLISAKYLALVALLPVAGLSANPASGANSITTPTVSVPASEPSLFKYASVPANAMPAIKKELMALAKMGALGKVDPNDLEICPPLGYYTLNAFSTGMPTEPTVGFFYAITSSGKPLLNIDLSYRRDPNNPSAIARLNTPAKTLNALNKLAALDEVKTGIYEARLLSIGTNNVYTVIWLKAQSGGTDFIYTAPDTGKGVKGNKLYSIDEFLSLILPILKQQAPANNFNGPPSRGGN